MNLETLARSLQSLDGEAAKTVQKAVEELAALRAERDRFKELVNRAYETWPDFSDTWFDDAEVALENER